MTLPYSTLIFNSLTINVKYNARRYAKILVLSLLFYFYFFVSVGHRHPLSSTRPVFSCLWSDPTMVAGAVIIAFPPVQGPLPLTFHVSLLHVPMIVPPFTW